ncbi:MULTISPECIES: F0F1 ATP synthase subunit gamma [Kordiimonas]|jgi:F-type H+-transporting ATPase subunit gamma|uniref:ATP synthase gamma chain n=1 Tax=Kordiimonas lacus TaxID=637679 RepID=A0A1G7A1L8_9PROT|nr:MULTISPECIES: F0F1 ATP synthase subunit gamma [Kordiimonas]SDE08670.1 F-type H+-transporting ATPase subunit gamma [Kordiimonas lacus]
MPSLKDLKIRINSVKSTQKITKAMKMVAASKLKRAQEAAEAARPYAERMEKVLTGLGASVAGQPGASPLLIGTGKDDVELVIVASSERGLCGGFNTNIVKAARIHLRELIAAGKTVKILCIGKKGFNVLRREFGDKIIDVKDMSGIKKLGFADAQTIAQEVLAMYERGEYDVATLFYAKFQSALVQLTTKQQLIPTPLPEAANENEAADELGGAAYDYEPDETAILDDLLPRNVAVQIYRGLLENAASEQGARMTAMDNATRNAGDMIDSLSITYNRTRQANITKELIEIISGAEAL